LPPFMIVPVLTTKIDYSRWELVIWNEFENFGMMSHSIERSLKVNMTWMTWWILIKTDIGLDAIPFQFLSTPTIPDYG
jgi:ABC-type uncharacterized transport system permease subunit